MKKLILILALNCIGIVFSQTTKTTTTTTTTTTSTSSTNDSSIKKEDNNKTQNGSVLSKKRVVITDVKVIGKTDKILKEEDTNTPPDNTEQPK